MKKYFDFDGSTMFVAKAAEIKAICKSLRRHDNLCDKRRMINVAPYALFTEFPKFRENGTYGLVIKEGRWYVMGADGALALIADDWYREA